MPLSQTEKTVSLLINLSNHRINSTHVQCVVFHEKQADWQWFMGLVDLYHEI